MSNPYNQEPPRFNNSVRPPPYGHTIGNAHQQNNVQQGIKKSILPNLLLGVLWILILECPMCLLHVSIFLF